MEGKKPGNYSLRIEAPMLIRDTDYMRRKLRCRTPADVYDLCRDMLEYAQEMFTCITINSRNYIIDRHLVTMGLNDQCLVHPREVFRHAILDAAAAIVLVHNHPSGDPSPSAEDVRITKQIVEVGKIVEIKVMDHIVIGKRPNPDAPGFVSMRECGLVQFQ